MKAPLPENEADRLKALYWYEILDSVSEQVFDDLALAASQVCGTPIAMITLIAENRQWFKSKIGLSVNETSRDLSFCAHAILKPGVFEVKDALKDPRFANNPLVATHQIRYYVGAPLVTSDGYALGTLCVLDRVPRELKPEQKEVLKVLSRIAGNLFKQRRYILEMERAAKKAAG